MAYLEELLPEFRNGAKIRRKSWPENLCISLKGCCGINIPFCDVNADDWELVLDNHIDWDYVVKNKCLCWFSDEDIEEPNFADRLLAIVENESGVKYMTEGKVTFVYCRPVCKDEVTFYEDKRDGNN